MMQLRGTLEQPGPLPLVKLLIEAGQSGSLSATSGRFSGVLFLDSGRVIGATVGNETGQAAFELFGLVFGSCAFEFSTAQGERQQNFLLEPAAFRAALERLEAERTQLSQLVPSLSAVPRADPTGAEPAQLTLNRAAISLLVGLDGRTVIELADGRGIADTLRQLAELARLQLVTFNEAEPAPSGSDQTSSATEAGAARPEPQRQNWSRWRVNGPRPEPQPVQHKD